MPLRACPYDGCRDPARNSLGTWYEKTEDDRYPQLVSVFLYQVPKLLLLLTKDLTLRKTLCKLYA